MPDVEYARCGDAHIAYQVVGDGPIDLVHVPGFVSHLDVFWEEPEGARFFRGLAGFSRLIAYDKRGVGLSDRISGDRLPPLEERIDELRAVLDAVGSKKAVLFGVSEGGPMSVLFAATHPERVAALVLFGASPHMPWGEGADPAAFIEERRRIIDGGWGKGALVARWAPSAAGDPRIERWIGRIERLGASPGAAVTAARMLTQNDVRAVLPSIDVPTLVIHRTGDRVVPVAAGRHFAEHIEGAVLREHPGEDHLPFLGDSDRVVGDIGEFLTGVRPDRDPDRLLTTILFTDIVGSTERAVALGDVRWRELLDQHDAIATREIEIHRGRLVKSTGDGVLASFDGPARAVRCALAMAREVRTCGLEIRAGLHTGEIQLRGRDDVGGATVHVAARVLSKARPGQVLCSDAVKDLLSGAGLELEPAGEHELKGIPGSWRLSSVRAGSAARSA